MHAQRRLAAFAVALLTIGAFVVVSCSSGSDEAQTAGPVRTDSAAETAAVQERPAPDPIKSHAEELFAQGREIFRNDSFGSEAFWGDQLELHKAILSREDGGAGEGLSPRNALKAGLKVDAEKVPPAMAEAIKKGAADLDDPANTVALLRAQAVVGVKGVFDQSQNLTSIGFTCALCHSTVDDSVLPGIGKRLDGWPNRDLNVGAIVAMAPNLKPVTDLLALPDTAVREVLNGWGPGRYDAELIQDGKATRPDGKSGATLIPAAFGLAGQNVHTYSGWGSVPYWNAYVANTQMHGKGTFVDRRLADRERFPVVARSGFDNKRDNPDLITSKLAALHFYQMAIPAPTPPAGSFDAAAAKRGEALFNGAAKCSTCHVPPLFSEPGWPMHTPEEIGIDDFQANRSPDRMYRTTPLRGLFARSKGGFYHDGRFPTLLDVVNHYDNHFKLNLDDRQKSDLVEYLKSL